MRAKQVSSRKTGLSARSQYSSSRVSARSRSKSPAVVQTKVSRQQQKHKKLMQESKAFLEFEKSKSSTLRQEISQATAQIEHRHMNNYMSHQAYPEPTITSGFSNE